MVSARVAVVTDSTAYLPPEMLDEHAITVVPLQVTIGDHSGDENVDISPVEVAAALTGHTRVFTSRPPPERFRAAYDRLVDEGATAIVTVTMSRRLSGTWESAVAAANTMPLEARVVDSRSTAMGLGFAVLAAARAAAAGAVAGAVEDAAREQAAATRMLFSVDTLEYLRRGGRISAAVRAFVAPRCRQADLSIPRRRRDRLAREGAHRLASAGAARRARGARRRRRPGRRRVPLSRVTRAGPRDGGRAAFPTAAPGNDADHRTVGP